ncbi:MAG: tagaturonate epimerase family protein [Candidatus Neomarinimicrobiota bacterium]
MLLDDVQKFLTVNVYEQDQLAALVLAAGRQVHIYPKSVNQLNDVFFFIGKEGLEKGLYILTRNSDNAIRRDFSGELVSSTRLEPESQLICCALEHQNAAALRERFDFTWPVLIGLDNSIGLGDRLGLANPGHLRALMGSGLRPVLAQQSIRELERTERTAEEVMDAATWAVFQEGYKEGFGSDADHLKTTADIDVMVKAGFTMFTIDPGAYVINEADTLPVRQLEEHIQSLAWDWLDDSLDGFLVRYAGREFAIREGFRLRPGREEVLRALAKYGGVLTHTVRMVRYLRSTYPDYPVEIELSVDETESVTTPFEHFLVVSELKRLGVELVSLAPRFIGDFEKGIDYKGDLNEFRDEFIKHVAIAELLGPYKISFHSGSDKFKVYELVGSLGHGRIHIKTAGTSYLEALRTVAQTAPSLFREILDFSREHYEAEKRTYHVSADPAKVAPAESYSDEELRQLFEQDDARQVLHVAFGRVLTSKDEKGGYLFKDRLLEVLKANESAHYENLRRHFRRHIQPFVN